MIKFTAEDKFIVTGASSGLGQGVAWLLNKYGATVIGVARNHERLMDTKNKCEHPENFFAEELDVTADIDGLPGYVKSLREKYGKFRGMAICHGITDVTPTQMLTYDNIKHVFDCDYFAPIMLAKGFVDRRNNIGRGAALVAISSYGALSCNRGMSNYAGAKSALIASMRCIAKEVVPFGIRVNTVSPSDIKTPMVLSNEFSTVRGADHEKHYPLGYGEVEDVANMVVFLLSDDAKWITTQNYIIDCGVGL
ncbi:MAG: SDR family oxidoreductase [Alphaproteobacteria bacterium]|nr:SDR family oxidoreductase [Alphaproteobacteria bacterium]